MGYDAIYKFVFYLNDNVDLLFTILLLSIRFTFVMSFLPGIGGGTKGKYIRMSGILLISVAVASSSPRAPMPTNWAELIMIAVSEATLGLALAFIPIIAVAGVQTAGQLSSTTMGLGMGQVVDPTSQANVTSVARVLGDLTILLFLSLGGHYVVIGLASGLSHGIVPGTFWINMDSLDVLVYETSEVFRVGFLIASPVIIALLLAQFVLGLISKAVPQFNIFIVSFPLTIGIGLALTTIMLPDMLLFLEEVFARSEQSMIHPLETIPEKRTL